MEESRREVSSRRVPFFQNLAKSLVKWGLTPNQVSVASSIFALVGACGLTQLDSSNDLKFYFSAAVSLFGIQMRLICNLIDGLMAVEGGLKTSTGELFNDIPDRFSDVFLIMGASMSNPWLGFIASIFAVMTAYVRVLGASLQTGHDFGGPLAKQHRMFVLNVAILASVIEKIVTGSVQYALTLGVLVIALGSAMTVWVRLNRISDKLSRK